MDPNFYRISDMLTLVRQPVDPGRKASAPSSVNHILVIDCSGSMWGELDKLRQQLKNKLPSLVNIGDTVSIVHFSSRGDYGVLIEGVDVKGTADLTTMNKAIDKFLTPRGATGFKEPIEEVTKIVGRIKNGNPFSLFFLSDGCDNVWPRADILKAVEKASGSVVSATVVEYGYYADRAFLTQMAEKFGGTHIFAESFTNFEPALDKAMQTKVGSGGNVDVNVGDAVGGFAFALKDGDLRTFAAMTGLASVPKDIGDVYYLVAAGKKFEPAASIHVMLNPLTAAVYAAKSLFAMRGKSDVVLELLRVTGDVRFIDEYGGLFGKQKISEYAAKAKAAAFEPNERYLHGCDPARIPKDDAFTVFDVLTLLASDEHNRVLLDSKDFKYNPIGRARQANEGGLKFTPDFAMAGYPVSRLVFNEDRPNVSIGVVKNGTVNLEPTSFAGPPPAAKEPMPIEFPTHIHRNYTIIKDGLVNVDVLPCLVTSATYEKLVMEGVAPAAQGASRHDLNIDGVTVMEVSVDLRKLPVVNRKQVSTLSAETFFRKQWELAKAQAEQKVINAYVSELVTKDTGTTSSSQGIEKKYGADAARWLKENGITDNGFSPKATTVAKSGDFYMAKELHTNLSGLSSLPTLKVAKDKIAAATAKKPAIIGARLMAPAIARVEAFTQSHAYQGAMDKAEVLKTWLTAEQEIVRKECRKHIADIARMTMVVVVGQTWFKEFNDVSEGSLEIEVDVPGSAERHKLACKVEMKEKQIDL